MPYLLALHRRGADSCPLATIAYACIAVCSSEDSLKLAALVVYVRTRKTLMAQTPLPHEGIIACSFAPPLLRNAAVPHSSSQSHVRLQDLCN